MDEQLYRALKICVAAILSSAPLSAASASHVHLFDSSFDENCRGSLITPKREPTFSLAHELVSRTPRLFAPGYTIGVARMVPPRGRIGGSEPDDVYSSGRSASLVITASPGSHGDWQTGFLQTVSPIYGTGFTHGYGYYEATLKIPADKVAWPAFWLQTEERFAERQHPFGEVDVLETSGYDRSNMYRITLHTWGGEQEKPRSEHRTYAYATHLPFEITENKSHRYGVMITHDWMTFFVDRREVVRRQNFGLFRSRYFPLLDLALHQVPQSQKPVVLAVQGLDIYDESAVRIVGTPRCSDARPT